MDTVSEIEWFLDEDDDEDVIVPQLTTCVDSITAKWEFLKGFKIPSLSEISEDFTAFQRSEDRESNLITSKTATNKKKGSETVQKQPLGGDTIKDKADFLKLFEIPSLSDISED